MAASKGELIAVFDADHAPFRAFLRETVGFFLEDSKLFLVQTPHVFLNPDPIEKNLRTFKGMPSENEMFYGASSAGSIAGTPLFSAARPRCCAAGRSRASAALRASPSPRIARPRLNSMPMAGTASMSKSR
jgi:hypothetical protein